MTRLCFNFNIYSKCYPIFIHFYMLSFIVMCKFIGCVYINSTLQLIATSCFVVLFWLLYERTECEYNTIEYNHIKLLFLCCILNLKVFNPDKLFDDLTFSHKHITSSPVCRSNRFHFIALIMAELQHLLTIIYLNNVSRRGQAYYFGIKINNNLPSEIKKKFSHIVKTILIGSTHLTL